MNAALEHSKATDKMSERTFFIILAQLDAVEAHRAVEHGQGIGGIGVLAEVAHADELEGGSVFAFPDERLGHALEHGQAVFVLFINSPEPDKRRCIACLRADIFVLHPAADQDVIFKIFDLAQIHCHRGVALWHIADRPKAP